MRPTFADIQAAAELISGQVVRRPCRRSLTLSEITGADVPGALAEVIRLLGDNNANIVEVRRQRTFTSLSLRTAEVEFVLQTLGCEHLRQIMQAIHGAGYESSLAELEASREGA